MLESHDASLWSTFVPKGCRGLGNPGSNRNQVQMMVQENKGHVMSLKEAQKVNRLQVEFLNISSSVGLVRIVPS